MRQEVDIYDLPSLLSGKSWTAGPGFAETCFARHDRKTNPDGSWEKMVSANSCRPTLAHTVVKFETLH